MFESMPSGWSGDSVGQGLKLTALLHLWQIPMALVSFGISAFAIGLTQIVYILPALIIAFRRNEKLKAQGLIIGAAITFLLNAACAGLVFQSIGG